MAIRSPVKPITGNSSPHTSSTDSIEPRQERIRSSFGTLIGFVLLLAVMYFVSDKNLIEELNDLKTTITKTNPTTDEFTTILDALESKEEHDTKYNTTTTTTTTTHIHYKGRVWYVGYRFDEVGRFVFPDYKNMDESNKWQLYGKQMTSDILVVGMHGPGAAQYTTFHNKFAGKILVVNGEPHGRIPTTNPSPRTYQLSGPMTEDMIYSKGNNPNSTFVRNYHGLRIFLGRFPDQYHKFFPTPIRNPTIPPQRARWNGTESRIVYANSNCVKHRQNAVQQLLTILPVDAAGKCTVPRATKVNIKRQNGWQGNWMQYANYKYCISMENSNPPGYVSEKIINAFMAGCLPIYYGTTEIYNIFHPNSFLFYDPKDPQELLNKIKYLETNRSAYDEMLSYPILRNGTDTMNKYFSISDEFGDGSIKRQIRDMMDIPT